MDKFFQFTIGNLITLITFLLMAGGLYQRFKSTENIAKEQEKDLKELTKSFPLMQQSLTQIARDVENYHMRLREVEKMDVIFAEIKGYMKAVKESMVRIENRLDNNKTQDV